MRRWFTASRLVTLEWETCMLGEVRHLHAESGLDVLKIQTTAPPILSHLSQFDRDGQHKSPFIRWEERTGSERRAEKDTERGRGRSVDHWDLLLTPKL